MTSYLTVSEADGVAAELAGLVAYKAGSALGKAAALLLASADVDAAHRWQGRRYDPAQEHEFPRIPYGDETLTGGDTAVIWDWDVPTQMAVVPEMVKAAVLFQADALLAGYREERLQAIADGLSAQQVGSVGEKYRATEFGRLLCLRAERLLGRYRLRQGKYV